MEVIRSGIQADIVLYTEQLNAKGRGLVNQLAHNGAETLMVSKTVMAACSDTESPSGILIVLPFTEFPIPRDMTLALVADRVADPGNLGAILRTAWAAGVEAVFLTEGCVDPFNPKVVRAGAGANLQLPIFHTNSEEVMDHLEGMEIWLAEKSEGIAYDDVDWKLPSTLVIGSEAHGAGDVLRSSVQRRIHIPIHSQVESLNAAVAAGIILFEIVRQREA